MLYVLFFWCCISFLCEVIKLGIDVVEVLGDSALAMSGRYNSLLVLFNLKVLPYNNINMHMILMKLAGTLTTDSIAIDQFEVRLEQRKLLFPSTKEGKKKKKKVKQSWTHWELNPTPLADVDAKRA